ncbi:hypothetical protein F8M41_016961 [Gigaspora margarita]|uniref:Uncharacterized protein n=1 Tax=Gigaspora margarita TaxID=4874 RepID=A0A8H4ANT2_GIGMA|nr:hypothetical protein F8M41_016961 [Gigaspora margarita]
MCRQLEDLHINQTKIEKAIKKNSSKPKSSCRTTKSKSKFRPEGSLLRNKTKKKKSDRSKCVNAHIISDESSSDSSDSKNSTTSSENELETNTLACSWNESGSSFSETSKSSNSESNESETRGYASLEEYEVNATKKKQLILIPRNQRSTKVPSQKLLAKNLVPLLIKRAVKILVDSFTHTQPKEVSINGYNMINAKFIALKNPVLNHFTSNFSDKEREKFWNEITMVFSHILQPISNLIRIAFQQANILSQKAPEEMQPEAEILWPNPIEINFIRKIIPNDVATITCQITSLSGKNIQVPGALIDSRANCSLKSKGFAKLLGMNIDNKKKPSVKWHSVQVSTNSSSPSSKDNNILLEEWHAPAGFSPDFSLFSEDDFLQSKSLDDKSEIQDFTSSLNHYKAGHFVSDLGLDSKSQCSAIKKNN